MIVESLIGAAALIVVSSLVLADRVHKRVMAQETDDPRRATFVERRRILERDRSEWHQMLRSSDKEARTRATLEMKEIDKALVALAKEEAAL